VRLLLIRHGQTPANVAGALDTAFPGAELTPLGRAQAGAVPAALAEDRLSGIYASTRIRTQLTAAPLVEAHGLDMRVCHGLEEVSAGRFEMRSDTDAVEAYAGGLVHWMRGDLDHRLPGGSTGHEFLKRYDEAVQGIAAAHRPADTVAVFSHGAAIRAYVALRAGLDPEVATELRIMNTGMGVLEGHPNEGWRLAHWSAEPLGGLELEDAAAHDVTGESAEDVAHDG
jgi:broad specificity phosphatase PhoE